MRNVSYSVPFDKESRTVHTPSAAGAIDLSPRLTSILGPDDDERRPAAAPFLKGVLLQRADRRNDDLPKKKKSVRISLEESPEEEQRSAVGREGESFLARLDLFVDKTDLSALDLHE